MNRDNDHAAVTDVDESPLARGVAVTGLLAAGALYYLYRRSRPGADLPPNLVAQQDQSGAALVRRGQHVLETTLDHLSNQAMGEVKGIIKNGLHRLEQIVDDL